MNVLLCDVTGGQTAMSIESLIQKIQPIGAIIAWWYFDMDKVPIPEGWALCNGQTVNGITTPDLRGRSIIMPNNGVACNYTADNTRACVGLGHTAGEAQHHLTVPEMPSHNHQAIAGQGGGGSNTLLGSWITGTDPNTSGNLSDPTIKNNGGDVYHNIVHPVLGVNYIIKVSHPKI